MCPSQSCRNRACFLARWMACSVAVVCIVSFSRASIFSLVIVLAWASLRCNSSNLLAISLNFSTAWFTVSSVSSLTILFSSNERVLLRPTSFPRLLKHSDIFACSETFNVSLNSVKMAWISTRIANVVSYSWSMTRKCSMLCRRKDSLRTTGGPTSFSMSAFEKV